MKQFCRTMLTVMGLAVAAALLSSIPAQAAGSSVINHTFNAGVGWFTPAGEFVNINVVRTNSGYMLVYNVCDFGGGFSGSGSIPVSSVNVSGGSVITGNVTVTLNVNTCDVTGSTFLLCLNLDF
jgi:hypothetical protein